jgi:hypothetical protein
MLFNSFDTVRGTLPDKLELMLREASNVFIKSFFSQKHLCQIRQVSRSNSLCESSQLLGGHLRQRHDQDLEGLVERLADVGERRLFDVTFSIADLHLNSVRVDCRATDSHFIKIKASSAVCRWLLRVKSHYVAHTGFSDHPGDFVSVELVSWWGMPG